MPVSRRGFLGALAGLVAAPMIVKFDAIMPVKVMKPEYLFPEMSFSIEKITVIAKSRTLKANWTMELVEDLRAIHGFDLRAIHGFDAENELIDILNDEILKEIKYGRNLQFHQSTDSSVLRPQGLVISTSNRPWIETAMPRVQLCGPSLRTDRILEGTS